MNEKKKKFVFKKELNLEEFENRVNQKFAENQAGKKPKEISQIDRSANDINKIGLPLINTETQELDWRDIGFREKVKRIEETVSFKTSLKATYIKKIILDSFLSNEARPEELQEYIATLKKSNPHIAARLLTEVLKSEHAERLLKLKERTLDEKPKTAPIIIVHNANGYNGADFNKHPIQYIESEKPKIQHKVDPVILDTEAADLANLDKKEF